MSPTVTTFTEVEAFAKKALPFLEARPVEHTTLLTLLQSIRRGLYLEPWLCAIEDAGALTGVAIRTSPRGLVLSRMSEACAAALAGCCRPLRRHPR